MLEEEIASAQRLVRTDAYQMSIGELVSLYKDNEIVIDPEFQRLFRWELGQKSKLIESLLLGIPLPSIFVFERENSKWELIDGLQRISTILEFMGILRSPDGGTKPPSYLEATKYLPSLSNVVWERSDRILDLPIDQQIPLDKVFQLTIRRARLSVEILKRPSDNNTKYDLFQRLNAAGTPANPQELRNCIIIMVNAEYYRFLKSISEMEAFTRVINATEEQIERQRHTEYASRFLSHVFVPYAGKLDVEEYIDESMKTLAAAGDITEAHTRFSATFSILDRLFGTDALRRFDGTKYFGRSSLAAFECIAIGIGRNIHAITALSDPEAFVRDKVIRFWSNDQLDRFFTPGLRGTIRIQRTIPFGDNWFRP